jgi:hypothetical protein
MKRVYIAGPMTGHANLNFPAFHAAASALRGQGFEVINPAEINGGEDEIVACALMTPQQLKDHWRDCMRNDITMLMTCDGVHMLPGWEMSKGATLEHHIASALGLEVTFA